MSTMDPAGDGGGGVPGNTEQHSTAMTNSINQQQQHPPPSPLSGCYLLVVLPEPHTAQHKDLILNRLAKGFLSWDKDSCHVDLEKELQALVAQAPEGEEARNGERLIQYATENLVTEVLIHPQTNTLLQCIRNLLASFTKHRHIIHAGYTFSGNGSWILQDGTFSLADFLDAFSEHEVQRVLRAYENSVTVDIHCAAVGDWTTSRLSKESCTRSCRVRVNPDDVLTAGVPAITSFTSYLEQYLVAQTLDQLMEPSDVVGNIRFSHPTLYVFPGGQGDAALFGINGFNMLVDGGFARKACFWDFARHLDRLDAVLVTRINNSNIGGISSVLRKKREMHVYPQIGHFFCNLMERRQANSPDGDKDVDPLILNLTDIGQEMMVNLRHIGLRPHPCYRDPEPINLYHKVGHGTLDMYVLSPSKDSREVREFLAKWHASDSKLFAGSHKKDSNNLIFPIQNLVSICALLVWQPANPEDTITRILFPGSTSQSKIFEGLERLKHLDFLKQPVCSAKSLSPSTSLAVLKDKPSKKLGSIEKETKKITEMRKEKMESKISKEESPPKSVSSTPIIPTKQPAKVEVKTKKVAENRKIEKELKEVKEVKEAREIKKEVKKESVKIEKQDETKKTDAIKTEIDKTAVAKDAKATKPEPKKKEVKEAKPAVKSSKPEAKSTKLMEKKSKPPGEKKDIKSSPTTPKRTLNGSASKVELTKATAKTISRTMTSKPSSATPAKSAKDANNRKVVAQKHIEMSTAGATTGTGVSRTLAKPKPAERKSISRRGKPASPSKARLPGSPAKSTRSTPTASVKSEKDGVIRGLARKGDKGTTDSSTVSTPSAIEPESVVKLVEKSEDLSLDSIESKVLADLKEEREVVEEIEAVLNKAERIEEARKDDHLEGDDEITAEATDKKDEDMTEEDVTAEIEDAPKKVASRKESQELTEEDEYLIVEKEEIYNEDSVISGDGEQKHLLDEVESEKVKAIVEAKDEVKEEAEEKKDEIPEKRLEFAAEKDEVVPEGYQESEKDLSPEHKEQLEEELKGIIASATEIVQKTEEKDDSGKKDSEDITKEPSSLSPDKFDSSEKKTTDTDLKPEVDQKEPIQEKLEESQERVSTLESGATTTAPTLPEDERIPLDEIKEDINEKYAKEEVKEKEAPPKVKEIFPQPTPSIVKPEVKVFDVRQSVPTLQRDIVKTPDEVADLPVHEEVDPKLYRMEDFEKDKEEKVQAAASQDLKEPETPPVKEQKGVFSFFGKVADRFEKGIDKLTGKSKRDAEKDEEKSSSKSSSPKEVKPQEKAIFEEIKPPEKTTEKEVDMEKMFPKVGKIEKSELFEQAVPKVMDVKVAAIKDTAAFLQEEIQDTIRKEVGVDLSKVKPAPAVQAVTEIKDDEVKEILSNAEIKAQNIKDEEAIEDAKEVEALLEEASKKFKTVKDSLRDSLESLEEKIEQEGIAQRAQDIDAKDAVKDTLAGVVERLEEIQPRLDGASSESKEPEKVKFDIPRCKDLEDFEEEIFEGPVRDLKEAVRDVGEVLAGTAGIEIDDKPKDVIEIVKKVAEVLKDDDFLSEKILFQESEKLQEKEKADKPEDKITEDKIQEESKVQEKPQEKVHKPEGPSDKENEISDLKDAKGLPEAKEIKEVKPVLEDVIIPKKVGITEELPPQEEIEEMLQSDIVHPLPVYERADGVEVLEEPCIKVIKDKGIELTSPTREPEKSTKEICEELLIKDDVLLSRKRRSIIEEENKSLDDFAGKVDVMEAGLEESCVKKEVKRSEKPEDEEDKIEEPEILFQQKLSPGKAEVVMVTPDSAPTSPKFALEKTDEHEFETRFKELPSEIKEVLSSKDKLEDVIEELIVTRRTRVTIEIIEYITVVRRVPRERLIYIIEEIIVKNGIPREDVLDEQVYKDGSVPLLKRIQVEEYIIEEYITKGIRITISIVEEISIRMSVPRRVVIEIIEEIVIKRKLTKEKVLNMMDEELSLILEKDEGVPVSVAKDEKRKSIFAEVLDEKVDSHLVNVKDVEEDKIVDGFVSIPSKDSVSVILKDDRDIPLKDKKDLKDLKNQEKDLADDFEAVEEEYKVREVPVTTAGSLPAEVPSKTKDEVEEALEDEASEVVEADEKISTIIKDIKEVQDVVKEAEVLSDASEVSDVVDTTEKYLDEAKEKTADVKPEHIRVEEVIDKQEVPEIDAAKDIAKEKIEVDKDKLDLKDHVEEVKKDTVESDKPEKSEVVEKGEEVLKDFTDIKVAGTQVKDIEVLPEKKEITKDDLKEPLEEKTVLEKVVSPEEMTEKVDVLTQKEKPKDLVDKISKDTVSPVQDKKEVVTLEKKTVPEDSKDKIPEKRLSMDISEILKDIKAPASPEIPQSVESIVKDLKKDDVVPPKDVTETPEKALPETKLADATGRAMEPEPKEQISEVTKIEKGRESPVEDTVRTKRSIKESTEEDQFPEEKDSEDESKALHETLSKDDSTVRRMLVTASSEDGGQETVICPVGSITFTKTVTPDDSLKDVSTKSTPEKDSLVLDKDSLRSGESTPERDSISGKSTPDIRDTDKITPEDSLDKSPIAHRDSQELEDSLEKSPRSIDKSVPVSFAAEMSGSKSTQILEVKQTSSTEVPEDKQISPIKKISEVPSTEKLESKETSPIEMSEIKEISLVEKKIPLTEKPSISKASPVDTFETKIVSPLDKSERKELSPMEKVELKESLEKSDIKEIPSVTDSVVKETFIEDEMKAKTLIDKPNETDKTKVPSAVINKFEDLRVADLQEKEKLEIKLRSSSIVGEETQEKSRTPSPSESEKSLRAEKADIKPQVPTSLTIKPEEIITVASTAMDVKPAIDITDTQVDKSRSPIIAGDKLQEKEPLEKSRSPSIVGDKPEEKEPADKSRSPSNAGDKPAEKISTDKSRSPSITGHKPEEKILDDKSRSPSIVGDKPEEKEPADKSRSPSIAGDKPEEKVPTDKSRSPSIAGDKPEVMAAADKSRSPSIAGDKPEEKVPTDKSRSPSIAGDKPEVMAAADKSRSPSIAGDKPEEKEPADQSRSPSIAGDKPEVMAAADKSRSPSIAGDKPEEKEPADQSRSPSIVGDKPEETVPADKSRSPSIAGDKPEEKEPADQSRSPSIPGDKPEETVPADKSRSPSIAGEKPEEKQPADQSISPGIAGDKREEKEPADKSRSPSIAGDKPEEKVPADKSRSPSIAGDKPEEKEPADKSRSPSIAGDKPEVMAAADKSRSPSIAGDKPEEKVPADKSRSPSIAGDKPEEKEPADKSRSPSIAGDKPEVMAAADKSRSPSIAGDKPEEKAPADKSRSPSIAGDKPEEKVTADKSRSPSIAGDKPEEKEPADKSRSPSIARDKPEEMAPADKSRSPSIAGDKPEEKVPADKSRSPSIAGDKPEEKEPADKSRSPSIAGDKPEVMAAADKSRSPSIAGDKPEEKVPADKSRSPSIAGDKPEEKEAADKSRSSSIVGDLPDDKGPLDKSISPSIACEESSEKKEPSLSKSPSISSDKPYEKEPIDLSKSTSIAGEIVDVKRLAGISVDKPISLNLIGDKPIKQEPVDKSRSPSIAGDKIIEIESAGMSKSPSIISDQLGDKEPIEKSRSPSIISDKPDEKLHISGSKSPSVADDKIDEVELTDKSRSPSIVSDKHDDKDHVGGSKSPSLVGDRVEEKDHISGSKTPSIAGDKIDEKDLDDILRSTSALSDKPDEKNQIISSKSPSVAGDKIDEKELIDRLTSAITCEKPERDSISESKSSSLAGDKINEKDHVSGSRSPSIAGDKIDEKELIQKSRSPSVDSDKPDEKDQISESKSSSIAGDKIDEHSKDHVSGSKSPSIAGDRLDEMHPTSRSRSSSIVSDKPDDKDQVGGSKSPRVASDKIDNKEPIDKSRSPSIVSDKLDEKYHIDDLRIPSAAGDKTDESEPSAKSRSTSVISDKPDEKEQVSGSRSPSIAGDKIDDKEPIDKSRSASIVSDKPDEKDHISASKSPSLAGDKIDEMEPTDKSRSPSIVSAKPDEKDDISRSKSPSIAGDKIDEKDHTSGSKTPSIAGDKIDEKDLDVRLKSPSALSDKSDEKDHIAGSKSPSIAGDKIDETQAAQMSRSSSIVSDKPDEKDRIIHSKSPSVVDDNKIDEKDHISSSKSSSIAGDKIDEIDPADKSRSPSVFSDKPDDKEEIIRSKSPSIAGDKVDEKDHISGSKSPSIAGDRIDETHVADKSRSPSIISDKADEKDHVSGSKSPSIADDKVDEKDHISGSKSPSIAGDKIDEIHVADKSRSPSIISEKADEKDHVSRSKSPSIAGDKADDAQPLDKSRSASIVSEKADVKDHLSGSKSPSIADEKADDKHLELDKEQEILVKDAESDKKMGALRSSKDSSPIEERTPKDRSRSHSLFETGEKTPLGRSRAASLFEDKVPEKLSLLEGVKGAFEHSASTSILEEKEEIRTSFDQEEDHTKIPKDDLKTPVDETKKPKEAPRSFEHPEDFVVPDEVEDLKTPSTRKEDQGRATDQISPKAEESKEVEDDDEDLEVPMEKRSEIEKYIIEEFVNKKRKVSSNVIAEIYIIMDVPRHVIIEIIEGIIVKKDLARNSILEDEEEGDEEEPKTEEPDAPVSKRLRIEKYILEEYVAKKRKITSKIVEEIIVIEDVTRSLVMQIINEIIIGHGLCKETILSDLEPDIELLDAESRKKSITESKRSSISSERSHESGVSGKITHDLDPKDSDTELEKSKKSSPDRTAPHIDEEISISEEKRTEVENYLIEDYISKGKIITEQILQEIIIKKSLPRYIILEIIEEIIFKRKIIRRNVIDETIFHEEDLSIGKDHEESSSIEKSLEASVLDRFQRSPEGKSSPEVSSIKDHEESTSIIDRRKRSLDDQEPDTGKSTPDISSARDRIIDISGKSTPDPKSSLFSEKFSDRSGYSTPEMRHFYEKSGKSTPDYRTEYESQFHKAFVGGITEIRTTHITTLSGKSTPDFAGRSDTPDSEAAAAIATTTDCVKEGSDVLVDVMAKDTDTGESKEADKFVTDYMSAITSTIATDGKDVLVDVLAKSSRDLDKISPEVTSTVTTSSVKETGLFEKEVKEVSHVTTDTSSKVTTSMLKEDKDILEKEIKEVKETGKIVSELSGAITSTSLTESKNVLVDVVAKETNLSKETSKEFSTVTWSTSTTSSVSQIGTKHEVPDVNGKDFVKQVQKDEVVEDSHPILVTKVIKREMVDDGEPEVVTKIVKREIVEEGEPEVVTKVIKREIIDEDEPEVVTKIVKREIIEESEPEEIVTRIIKREIIEEGEPEVITKIIKREIHESEEDFDTTGRTGEVKKIVSREGTPEVTETITTRTSRTIVTDAAPIGRPSSSSSDIEKPELYTRIISSEGTPEIVETIKRTKKITSESGPEYVTRIVSREGTPEIQKTTDVKRIVTTVTTITGPDGEVITKKDVKESSDVLDSEHLLEKLIDSSQGQEKTGKRREDDEDKKVSEERFVSETPEGLRTEEIIRRTVTTVTSTSGTSSPDVKTFFDSGKSTPDSKDQSEVIRAPLDKSEVVVSPAVRDLISDDKSYSGKSSPDISLPRDIVFSGSTGKSTPEIPVSPLIRDGASMQPSGRSTPDRKSEGRSRTATPEGFRSGEVIRTTITTTRTMSDDGEIITTTKEITEATNEKGETVVLAEKTDVKVDDSRTSSEMTQEPRYSDEETPASPLSSTSQDGKSLEFSAAAMSSSFYGELPTVPPLTTVKPAFTDPASRKISEPIPIQSDYSFKRFTVEKEFAGGYEPKSESKKYVDEADMDFEKALMDGKDKDTVGYSNGTLAQLSNGSKQLDPMAASFVEDSDDSKDPKDKKDPLAGWGAPLGLPSPKPPRKFNLRKSAVNASSVETTETALEGLNFDVINDWGEPLALPTPAPAPMANEVSNKGAPGTPKKERKQPKKVVSENIKNKKRSESPGKNEKKNKDSKNKVQPVYMDLTYVPHHGNSYYTSLEFFKRIRARYYVFSGTEPSREVYDALLEAKKTWEDKDLEVTMIPTYDTDTLGYWVADNEEALAANHIDLSPSASRCTINLQDHETSCSAYRLEF
ncbi:microtubule-associated protein futsch isoform X3 [Cephus cinctus]|uniref:Microtubule-associated protein futsch isoform X3 n=1 Tax=Cephus cinctus TaxID=211228 RepID=A0AAJ7REH7_CEPCN|nr:microtubule-associated protein futsch isoform X3 [Cephus cinctus]